MKDDDSLPTTTGQAAGGGTSGYTKKESLDYDLFGKGRYKFWALAAILLLAFWSMFTGTVSLRWSVGDLNGLSDNFDTFMHDDLNVLEMEEREKVVKHMWDVYVNSCRIRLPRFWQEAFEAAYEELTSDGPGIREFAITEIAKMSVRNLLLDPPPVQSTGYCFARYLAEHMILSKCISSREISKSLKQKASAAVNSKGSIR